MNEVRWREQLDSWHRLHEWSAQILAESASLVIREPPSSWWSPWESKQPQTRLCYQFQPNSNKKKSISPQQNMFCAFLNLDTSPRQVYLYNVSIVELYYLSVYDGNCNMAVHKRNIQIAKATFLGGCVLSWFLPFFLFFQSQDLFSLHENGCHKVQQYTQSFLKTASITLCIL